MESHGDYRSGVFQEFARGFGVRDYRFLLESGKANQTRLKTATEFKRREWGTEGFGSSLLRHALFAVYQAADQDSTKVGLNYLKTEIRDYWPQREILIEEAVRLRFATCSHANCSSFEQVEAAEIRVAHRLWLFRDRFSAMSQPKSDKSDSLRDDRLPGAPAHAVMGGRCRGGPPACRGLGE